ncbi:MAG: hypothetical protein AB1374_09565 [Bacillota bacterium]
MPNSGLPVNLPTLAILLLASTNKDVDRMLETVSVLAQNTQTALRNIRQGVQTIQSIFPLANNFGSPEEPGSAEKPVLPIEAESGDEELAFD